MNTAVIFALWNIVVFFVYGADKLRAKNGSRRIKETTLLLLAYLMGGVGAMFGMVVFNHKTSKLKFRLLIPFSVAFNVALVYAIQYVLQMI